MNDIKLCKIRLLQEDDIDFIVSECNQNNWPKPKSLFEQYYDEQNNLVRLTWLAFHGSAVTGYCTLKWQSDYIPFKNLQIAEIKDLNVFPKYRKKGIAAKLMEIAETEAFKKNDTIGIGVGLFKDYGNAQRLYVKRGYIPDGNGLTYNNAEVAYGQQVTIDDDTCLMLIKKIHE